jgi:hypothetical protein
MKNSISKRVEISNYQRMLELCPVLSYNKIGAFTNHCWRGKAVSITYLSLCVCVCVRACARARGCVCEWVMGGRGRVHALASVYPFLSSMQCVCDIFWHPIPLWLYSIFQHYLINGTIFEKKVLHIKCVFLFYLQYLSRTFLILRRI